MCTETFRLHYLAWILNRFRSHYNPYYMKTIFPHPQYVAPYIQVSHSHKTVLTIAVLNAELLGLVAEGQTKSYEMTGSTHTLNLI